MRSNRRGRKAVICSKNTTVNGNDSSDDEEESDDDTLNSSNKRRCHKLDTDKIAFYGSITRASMTELIQVLNAAARKLPIPRDKEERPRLYVMICSNGGDLYSALAAYDHMRKLRDRVDLVTVAEGFVASAGTVLLMAGNTRLATRNAGLLFHQLSSGIQGKYAELQDEVESCRWLMRKMCKLYTRKSNLTFEEVEKLLSQEKTLSAKKCIANGLVHGYY